MYITQREESRVKLFPSHDGDGSYPAAVSPHGVACVLGVASHASVLSPWVVSHGHLSYRPATSIEWYEDKVLSDWEEMNHDLKIRQC